MQKIQPIILAGGVGSRIWPLSRELFPKQLLNLGEDLSLMQATIRRLDDLPGFLPALVIVGEVHRFLVFNQIKELALPEPVHLLLEPIGRNTAAAICGGVLFSEGLQQDDEVVYLVLPADHLIGNLQGFREAVARAAPLALNGRLVTFGLKPLKAETGFGYIEKEQGGNRVLSFVEKPGRETAEGYIKTGNFFWNSGIFAFTKATFLAEMEKYAPEIEKAMAQAVHAGKKDEHFFHLERQAMTACPNISIDYALMEKSTQVSMVEADLAWNDIGSWQAVWEISAKDAKGNVVQGDVILTDVGNSLIRSEYRLVTALGLQDILLVETADAVLVAPLNRSQEVREIVQQLKLGDREESRLHRTVYRPWGSYTLLEEQPGFKIKRLTVTPKMKLSMQMHHHRSEHWVVVNGSALVTCGEKTMLITENESTYIPCGEKHRLENPGIIPLEIIEVQNGSYLGEDDIIRFDDDFNRQNDEADS